MSLADDLIAVLDDPTHMWSHALKELSLDAQRLFLTLTLLPKPVSSDVLQIAYTSQTPDRAESFLDSLRSLEDSFISIDNPWADLRSVSFRNPSLQDFATAYLNSNPDWLDSLLSGPKYYEQVISVFNLAMAQAMTFFDTQTRSKVDGPPKYPGIKRWVDYRSPDLITIAINLLGAERAEIFFYSGRTRFARLLEIVAAYGMPTEREILGKLQAATTAALNPVSREEARVVVRFLQQDAYRKLLDGMLRANAAAVMRENVLDKDNWKFAILAELDEILDIDSENSWGSWGEDYMGYARQLAEELVESGDHEDLRAAIDELTSISNMLDVDLYSEISQLEERYENLPSDDDYDDSQSPTSVGSVDESAQLDNIFASLL